MKRCFQAVAGLCVFCVGALLLLLLYNTRTPPDSDLTAPWLTNATPAPWTVPRTLTIITFNVHDLYVASTHRPLRMEAIGDAIAAHDPDLVGIQEAFIAADRSTLQSRLMGSRLAFSHYFPSGTVGSGLWILSAYPIEAVAFHRYSRNGKWYKLWHGDWWAGKGVAFLRVAVGPQQYFDLYNTHAHARYGTHEYDGDRAQQLEELAAFMAATHAAETPAVLVGDLNCRRGDPEFDRLTAAMPLQSMNDNLDGIDHVFSLRANAYSVQCAKIEVLDGTLMADGNELSWSDHCGYAVVAEFQPRLHDAGRQNE